LEFQGLKDGKKKFFEVEGKLIACNGVTDSNEIQEWK